MTLEEFKAQAGKGIYNACTSQQEIVEKKKLLGDEKNGKPLIWS